MNCGSTSVYRCDIPIGSSKRTWGFSGSLHLRSKDFDTTLSIVFTKSDLPLHPLPEKNMWTGLTLTPLCLTQLRATLNISRYLEFRGLILWKILLSGMFLDIKFGIAQFLFDFVFSSSWSLKYTAFFVSSFLTWPKGSWLSRKVALLHLNLILLMFITVWTPCFKTFIVIQ